jgi:uncharacterized repeat protein (TIGR03803 family)
MLPEPCKSSLDRSLVLFALALSFCAFAHATPKYKVLHNFNGTDGIGSGSPTLDQHGNLYGTSLGGGTGSCKGGCGLVFQLTPHANRSWSESILYSFQGSDDGESPSGALIFDHAGRLYGTTTYGGVGGNKEYCHPGCGVAFKLTPTLSGGWTENVLFAFDYNDGAEPTAGLIMDEADNLYGTAGGGVNGGGVAFELTPGSGGWNETVLKSFYPSDYPDYAPGGSSPYAGLTLGETGNLYGVTEGGGNGPPHCPVSEGCGVVFELSMQSGRWKEHVLHRFTGFSRDGAEPSSGVTLDSSGNLYGTTTIGGGTGCEGGCGTVYKLTPQSNGKWKETLLYNFGNGQNGYAPDGGVVIDKAGVLYGTTGYSGSGCGCGVVYKLAPGKNGKWTYTVLHAFTGSDGAVPAGGLTMDDKGNLYGGTVLGGADGYGVVFELTP